MGLKARNTVKRAAIAVALLLFLAAPALFLHRGVAPLDANSTAKQASDALDSVLPVDELLSLRYGTVTRLLFRMQHAAALLSCHPWLSDVPCILKFCLQLSSPPAHTLQSLLRAESCSCSYIQSNSAVLPAMSMTRTHLCSSRLATLLRPTPQNLSFCDLFLSISSGLRLFNKIELTGM